MNNKENIELALQFKELSDYYKNNNDKFRFKTFLNAYDFFSKYPIKIINPNEQLKNIPNIGQGIIKRVDEYIKFGYIQELQNYKNNNCNSLQNYDDELQNNNSNTDKNKIIDELILSYGIGIKTAEKLYNEGITGINDLIIKYNKGLVNLTKNQVIGLYYYNDFLLRIPRDEIKKIGKNIKNIIKDIDNNNLVKIVGSYRRKTETSGDIDILISNINNINHLSKIINKLESISLLCYIFTRGNLKVQAVYNSEYPSNIGIMRKIDLRYVPYDSWITSLIHSTGSDKFNIYLRKISLQKGYTLSEYGLYYLVPNSKVKGDKVIINREIELFNLLGLDYIKPCDR